MEYLTRPEQYSLVYFKGSLLVSNLIVLRVLPNGLSLSRCGFSIGKRVGKAVVRNKVKRRLREIIRRSPLKPGWDIVLVARPLSAPARFSDLKIVVDGLLAKAKILNDSATTQ